MGLCHGSVFPLVFGFLPFHTHYLMLHSHLDEKFEIWGEGLDMRQSASGLPRVVIFLFYHWWFNLIMTEVSGPKWRQHDSYLSSTIQTWWVGFFFLFYFSPDLFCVANFSALTSPSPLGSSFILPFSCSCMWVGISCFHEPLCFLYCLQGAPQGVWGVHWVILVLCASVHAYWILHV